MSAITIIAPCFNEADTIGKFLLELESVLGTLEEKFMVLIVDDASMDDTLETLKEYQPKAENITLKVLSLRYNVGHQKAIYQGLLYASELESERFIIMDSDGEDDPAVIPELLKHEAADIVNVVRGHRENSLLFIGLYSIYKLIFFLVTGKRMNFGNYCMINRKMLVKTVDTSYIHLAAYLSKQKVKIAQIKADRKKRLDGNSKMGLNSLIQHAFKSFMEYADNFLMLFLNLFIVIVFTFSLMIAHVFYKKLFTDKAILGWASTFSSILFSTAIVCLGFFATGILLLNILSKQGGRPEKKIYTVVR